MARREWRARANLTGDPWKDRKTREAMLDALHESLVHGQQSTADMNEQLRGRVEVEVGDPVREVEGQQDEGEEA